MEKIDWIRKLIHAEQTLEDSGMIDFESAFNNDNVLKEETINFLKSIKNHFIDASNIFNELKTSQIGKIKIYGIAQTHADFMLFRNGLKLIFSLVEPGKIKIYFNFINTDYIPNTPQQEDNSNKQITTKIKEDFIEAQIGAFNSVNWYYKNTLIKEENLVKYYLSIFIQESAK